MTAHAWKGETMHSHDDVEALDCTAKPEPVVKQKKISSVACECGLPTTCCEQQCLIEECDWMVY